MSKGKRGHRGKKEGKNARDARKWAAKAPTSEQDQSLVAQSAQAASEQEQDHLAEAQAAQAAFEARQNQSLLDAQAAQAALDVDVDVDMGEEFEGQPSVEHTSDEQFFLDQLAEADEEFGVRPSIEHTLDERLHIELAEENDEVEQRSRETSGRESFVSWSSSPEAHLHPEPLSAVQPYGDVCFVICRLSSEKKRKGDATVQAAYNRRMNEGRIVAERLASNCPNPVQFEAIHSYCGTRHSGYTTDWEKVGGASAFVKDIRRILESLKDRKVTILVRTVDGISTNPQSIQGFLNLVKRCRIDAQLIFQWIKIFDEIRPISPRNCRGVGSTADFMAADFLAHMEGTKLCNKVQKILDMLAWVELHKAAKGGIQDRNAFPSADLEKAVEVTGLAAPVGR
ncbi:hypothetical protein HBI04_144180 [Parastagonospora nodorum]|nr:hypothetical protein HBH51_100940 [Parastagonospora nodorum]KAH4044745.1 hypothetical protein HBH49_212580 [Parastagonospora nodorum]KAH4116879.1 hypothetical protein HBH47_162430 [Parastagonospora nodorum]KAH4160057.1 hypothetical protein HBH43_181130 [Parastagonospora nodorum]KAH4258522.1 hypothetical protein HBI03_144830 [Parastagonospora nodorum]